MLTSKELLARTGISRATLNNYIALGVVPKPTVMRPTARGERARRLGYFPDDAVDRVQTVQRLKAEGFSIAEIAERLSGTAAPGGGPGEGGREPAAATRTERPPQPEQRIRGLPKDGRPVLTPLCAVAAALDSADKIRAALPLEEYVEVIDQILALLDGVLGDHHGGPCSHRDARFVCYLFPQSGRSYLLDALVAAQTLKERMAAISGEWQRRKAWTNELHLNIGLHAAEDWIAAFRSTTGFACSTLGDTAHQAAQICRFARLGTVWASKVLIAKLTREERALVRFGIHRTTSDGREVLVPQTYARVCDLADLSEPTYVSLRDVAVVAVTEVLDVERATPAVGSQGRS